MSYEGSRANRQQTIVTYLCPDWNIFSLTSLYQLLAAIYFHRPSGVAQRVGGLRLFMAIIPPITSYSRLVTSPVPPEPRSA
jgi:hypothetical protein